MKFVFFFFKWVICIQIISSFLVRDLERWEINELFNLITSYASPCYTKIVIMCYKYHTLALLVYYTTNITRMKNTMVEFLEEK